jgi:hypothetical protein
LTGCCSRVAICREFQYYPGKYDFYTEQESQNLLFLLNNNMYLLKNETNRGVRGYGASLQPERQPALSSRHGGTVGLGIAPNRFTGMLLKYFGKNQLKSYLGSFF